MTIAPSLRYPNPSAGDGGVSPSTKSQVGIQCHAIALIMGENVLASSIFESNGPGWKLQCELPECLTNSKQRSRGPGGNVARPSHQGTHGSGGGCCVGPDRWSCTMTSWNSYYHFKISSWHLGSSIVTATVLQRQSSTSIVARGRRDLHRGSSTPLTAPSRRFVQRQSSVSATTILHRDSSMYCSRFCVGLGVAAASMNLD